MHFKNYDLENLPFSPLFQQYATDFSQVEDFYETNPHRPDQIRRHANYLQFRGDREKTANLLASFNSGFDVKQPALENIEKLKNPKAMAIVTGQQLGIYGGPIYTFFKTLTTIHLADHYQQVLDRPVIPVFWLADEDHDYDEIRSVNILNDDGLESFSLPRKVNGLPPVSDLYIPAGINKFRSELRATLIDTDFTDELWELLDSCFKGGTTFREGFGRFIAQLFSGHGLVLAGSNDLEIKQQLKDPMITAVQQADETREALQKQTYKVESKYHQQAKVYDSHLFYLHPEEGRIKIERNDNLWKTGEGQQWSTDELAEKIEKTPELFSPDVFLRPILQDRLLPAMGYVAGPGEVAYYGQMKLFYDCFDQKMPLIFPRLSATFVEPAIDRIFHELPFGLPDYNKRIEDLESDFVKQNAATDVEQIFDNWKEEIGSISISPISEITSVDDTLEGAAGKAMATYFNALDKLKGKTYRAIKKREEIQLNRIRRIQQNVFPGGNLQERSLAGIYFMNKFGLDIWDRLLNEMEGIESLDKHQLIFL